MRKARLDPGHLPGGVFVGGCLALSHAAYLTEVAGLRACVRMRLNLTPLSVLSKVVDAKRQISHYFFLDYYFKLRVRCWMPKCG